MIKRTELIKLKKFTLEKPKRMDYNKGTHSWKLVDGSDEIDIFAYDGDSHNGPRCIKCNFGGCHHCNPEIYKDNNCPYLSAMEKWNKDKYETIRFNDKAKVINIYIKTGKVI